MKIAVVGTGSIGASHLEAISTSSSCTLCAVCDVNEEVAKQYSEMYNVPYFTDYKLIPANCDADAVILNLPHWLHCEVTDFFLDNGIHVLVEKPMANTPEECKRMIAAQKRSGKHLAVAHPQRFIHANRIVKDFVRSGDLGKLCMITEFRSVNYFVPTRPKWFLNKALAGGGIVMNYGAHALDKILYITESHPVSITSSVANIKTDHDIEGHAQICVTLENGVSASISFCGYESFGYETVYYFTNGALKVVNSSHLFRYEAGQWVKIEVPESPNCMEMQLEAFCKLIRGELTEIPSAEFGEEVIEIIDKIYKG